VVNYWKDTTSNNPIVSLPNVEVSDLFAKLQKLWRKSDSFSADFACNPQNPYKGSEKRVKKRTFRDVQKPLSPPAAITAHNRVKSVGLASCALCGV